MSALYDSDGRPLGPGGRSFTDEQAAVVARRAGPLLVSANAGSGKTTVLAERFVRGVLEDGIAAEAMLAITFTDKAAGELRKRIRDRFAELGERERARDAEAAAISTIHGFCAAVLRAHAVIAGLDPGFVVLDEPSSRALRMDSFDRALGRFLDNDRSDPPAPRLDALDLVAAWTPDRLRGAIFAVHDELRSRGSSEPRLPAAPAVAPLEPLLARLLAAAADAEAQLAGAPSLKSIDAARDALAACRERLSGQPPGEPAPGATLAAALFKCGSTAALQGDRCSAYLQAHAAYAAACRDHAALPAHALLDELLRAFAAEYAAAKTRARALDYDDLELRARDLFIAQPAVAAGYADRFARIMVDELQDTNPLQLEILAYLDRGNLFLVGDELQAIYGFRHADVAGFRRKRDELPSAELTVNWRAQPEILETLNGAFGRLHDRYAPLRPGRHGKTTPAPLTELLLVDKGAWEDEHTTPELRERLAAGLPAGPVGRHAEARAVARRIRALVDDDDIRPQDVVVLLRAATDMTLYERALELEGLATLATGGRGFWARQQVQDLLAYLAALTNPRDEAALWTLLASPLAGVSSDAMALLALKSRELAVPVWEVLQAAGELGPLLPAADHRRVDALRTRLRAERELAPRLALDTLLERVIADTGYDLHVLALPGGRRRLANVAKLVRLAAAFESRRGRDVRGFIDHALAELDADAREPEAPVELADLAAVRLMTIHAAKGLEFPVVVVADLGRRGNAATADLLVDGARVGLRLVTVEGPSEGAFAHDELKREAQAAQAAEERRVLHVALTRAQERLILSGAVCVAKPWPADGPGAPPLAWLGPALAREPGHLLPSAAEHADLDDPRPGGRVRLRVRRVAPADAQAALGLGPPAADEPQAPPAAAPPAEAPAAAPAAAPPAVPRLAALSYSALSAYSACAYRFYLERVLRLPRDHDDARALAGAAAGLDARARGTVAHELLQQLDFAAPEAPPPADVRVCARRLGVELADEDVEDLLGLVGRFAGSGLCRRLAASRDLRREQPFSFVLDDDAPLLTGIVDVRGREPDGALVVDYKSDRVADDADLGALVERDYGAQRRIYALAELRAGAAAVEVVHVYLQRPDDAIAARFTRADVSSLEAEVRGLLDGLAAGAFPVAVEPHRGLCAGCPGRRALCSHDEELTARETVSA